MILRMASSYSCNKHGQNKHTSLKQKSFKTFPEPVELIPGSLPRTIGKLLPYMSAGAHAMGVFKVSGQERFDSPPEEAFASRMTGSLKALSLSTCHIAVKC